MKINIKNSYISIIICLVIGIFSQNAIAEWTEVSTNKVQPIDAGPGYYYDSEQFMPLSQYQYIFTIGIESPIEMQIKYDGGLWINIGWGFYEDLGRVGSDLITPPWTELGSYAMEFRWKDVSGDWQEHAYPVTVVESVDHRYWSNGNEVAVWLGGSTLNRPMVIAEGFDNDNTTNYPELFSMGADLFNSIRNYEVDIAIVNFADGGISMSDNAAVVQSAVNYLNSIQQGTDQTIFQCC